MKYISAKRGNLINLIFDYMTERQMSIEDLETCVKEIKEIYYKEAIVIRGVAHKEQPIN